MQDIKPSKIETFVDNRLSVMSKTALMWGSPEALESQCFTLLDLIEEFCVEEPRDVQVEFQKFRREIYPKCPGPMTLATWLTDEKYGLGLEWKEAAHTIVDFFIQLRNKMKIGNS